MRPDKVIYVGALSKLLLPALRIGYIAAPEDVIDAIAHRVSLVDGMGNTLTEDAATKRIESGELLRHARKVRQVYASRRKTFAATLNADRGDIVDYAVPDGGPAFWLRFRRHADLERVEARAPGMGLRFAASASFMTSDDADRGLRVGFASLTPFEARNALGALAAAAKSNALDHDRHPRK